MDEPYVALQRASAPGSTPGHAVVVDLSLSDLANGRAPAAAPRRTQRRTKARTRWVGPAGVTTSIVEAPPSAATTYAMRIPLAQVYSLRKFVPTLGISFLIITARSTESFPPLYFHDGYRGLHDFVQALGSYAAVSK